LHALVASVPVASGQSVRFKGPVADPDVIHQQAASLFETPAAWRRAAHLLKQEGEIRAPQDPAT
jgi:hypothetical protein